MKIRQRGSGRPASRSGRCGGPIASRPIEQSHAARACSCSDSIPAPQRVRPDAGRSARAPDSRATGSPNRRAFCPPGKLFSRGSASLISQPIQPRRNSSLDFSLGHWPTKSAAHMRPRAPAHSLSQITCQLMLHKTRDDRLSYLLSRLRTSSPPQLRTYQHAYSPCHLLTHLLTYMRSLAYLA